MGLNSPNTDGLLVKCYDVDKLDNMVWTYQPVVPSSEPLTQSCREPENQTANGRISTLNMNASISLICMGDCCTNQTTSMRSNTPVRLLSTPPSWVNVSVLLLHLITHQSLFASGVMTTSQKVHVFMPHCCVFIIIQKCFYSQTNTPSCFLTPCPLLLIWSLAKL